MLNLGQASGGVTVPPPGSATAVAIRRLQKDYVKLQTDPIDGITALPNEDNILEWHYCLRGSPDTPFQGGYYWGKVIFKENFPWSPPAITMITPNGRFATNTRLCLSISDYHPESWNPGWTVSAILIGLHSFMNENQPAAGAVSGSPQEQKNFAMASKEFNVKYREFRKFFPQYVKEWTGVLPTENEPNVAPVMLPEHATPTGVDVPQIQNHSSRAAFNAAHGRRAMDGAGALEEIMAVAAGALGAPALGMRQAFGGVAPVPNQAGFYPPANYMMYYQGQAPAAPPARQAAPVAPGAPPPANANMPYPQGVAMQQMRPANAQQAPQPGYEVQQQQQQQQQNYYDAWMERAANRNVAGPGVIANALMAAQTQYAQRMIQPALGQPDNIAFPAFPGIGVPQGQAVGGVVPQPYQAPAQAQFAAPAPPAPVPGAPVAQAAAAAAPPQTRGTRRGRGTPQNNTDDEGNNDDAEADGASAAKKARVGVAI